MTSLPQTFGILLDRIKHGTDEQITIAAANMAAQLAQYDNPMMLAALRRHYRDLGKIALVLEPYGIKLRWKLNSSGSVFVYGERA